jgi:hypothetical protein
MRNLAMDVWFCEKNGFSEAVLARVGKLVLSWAFFEHHLETQLLQVIGFPLSGEVSPIDKDPTMVRLKQLRLKGALQRGVDEDRLDIFVATAQSVLNFRNHLAHGVPVPSFAEFGMPAKSLNNYGWDGMPRGRKMGAATIAEAELDDILWVIDVLHVALGRGNAMSQIEEKLGQVVMAPNLAKANSVAARVLENSMLGVSRLA